MQTTGLSLVAELVVPVVADGIWRVGNSCCWVFQRLETAVLIPQNMSLLLLWWQNCWGFSGADSAGAALEAKLYPEMLSTGMAVI